MPVTINTIRDGTPILLNLRPTRIIIDNLPSIESEIVLRRGARTIPINIEPPTQIDAAIRCAHIINALTSDMTLFAESTNNIYYHLNCGEGFLIEQGS